MGTINTEVDSLGNANSVANNQMNAAYTKRELREAAGVKKAAKSSGSEAKKPVKTVEKPAVADEPLDRELVNKMLDEANKKIFGNGRMFNVSVHEATNRVIIQVLDLNTKEIIKEIPPEKTLNALAKMWELAGLIVDERL